MLSHFVWFLVVLGGALAIVGAAQLAQLATPAADRSPSVRSSALIFVAVTAALLVIGGLWRIHAIARADARVVHKLVHDRGTTLNQIFSFLTTTGDLVPSFVIATTIALWFYLRTRRHTAWLLPAAVLVQVFLQSGFINVFHDPTIAKIIPGITIGGSDGIPSGSMSRLFAIFLIAAILWQRTDEKVARRFAEFGLAVVFVELITRLYLARHLLIDIVGGLLLGVLLTIAVGWLIHFVEQPAKPGVTRTMKSPAGVTS